MTTVFRELNMDPGRDERPASIAELQAALGKLIREREDVLKRSVTSDQDSATWYLARLKIVDKRIHQIRNQIFIARTAQ